MRALRIAAAICVAAALLSLSLAVVSAHRGGDGQDEDQNTVWVAILRGASETPPRDTPARGVALFFLGDDGSVEDRKSTRLNSSHSQISYAVFCLKKKKYHRQEKSQEQYHAYSQSKH